MINEFYDWWVAQVEAEATDEDTETDTLAALDNEAYRRDFPEMEYNRWEDDGGSYTTVETTKFGGAGPSSIRIYGPGQKTLGELLDEQMDLTQPVSEDARVSVAADGRYAVIVIERNDDE